MHTDLKIVGSESSSAVVMQEDNSTELKVTSNTKSALLTYQKRILLALVEKEFSLLF